MRAFLWPFGFEKEIFDRKWREKLRFESLTREDDNDMRIIELLRAVLLFTGNSGAQRSNFAQS